MLLPRKILSLIPSFLRFFDTPPSCINPIGVGAKLDDCFISSLTGTKRPSNVNPLGPNVFENSLALPTAQLTERRDFRTILDFLLMTLKTALDKDWIQNLPILQKVGCFYLSLSRISTFRYSISVFSRVCCDYSTPSVRPLSSLKTYPTIGIGLESTIIKLHGYLPTDFT